MSAAACTRAHAREARARIVTMTIHKLVLGTGYSGTAFCHARGALHVQLCMDDVIGPIFDDVMVLAYTECMGTDHRLVHKNSKG